MPELFEFEDRCLSYARIKVIGIGNSGGKMLNNMITQKVRAVEFVFVCTDAIAIEQSLAETTLQLGSEAVPGLGSFGSPAIAREAAINESKRIREILTDLDMVILVAGMGGGTGTGAAPVIAEAAKSLGILTLAVVTKPLMSEGKLRMRLAEDGIEKLGKFADSVIMIPNQKLLDKVKYLSGDMPERVLKVDDGF